MKHEFRLTRPAHIAKKELAAGDLVAIVEVPEGLPLDRVMNAIINGHATESEPPAPAPTPAPPAAEARPAAKKKPA